MKTRTRIFAVIGKLLDSHIFLKLMRSYLTKAQTTLFFFIVCLAGPSCHLQRGVDLTPYQNVEMSQKIISGLIAYWARTDSASELYVDPVLCERNMLFNKPVFEDPELQYPNLFSEKRKKSVLGYVIPDSLAQRVKYRTHSIDVENGPETVFFFSYLIPTREKHIYAIQDLACYSMDAGFSVLRVASRSYFLFEVKNGRYKLLRQEPASSEMVSLPLLK